MTEQLAPAIDQAPLPSPSRATFAVTIGNMLEFYDFITYSFFAIQIGRTFFPTHGEFGSLMLSLATFGAGFITRPIGALVLGTYSDRVGRKPAMVLSFTMMGCAIILLALTPSYESIGIAAPILAIIARMVQGFSLGGEVGPTTAYLLEAAAPGRRGLAVSWQPASQQIAATIGALVGVILSETMSTAALDAYGWRIAFLLGAVCLPFGLWMRRGLPETLHLQEIEQATGSVSPEAVRKRARRRAQSSSSSDPRLARARERHDHHLRHPIYDDLCREHVACTAGACVRHDCCQQRTRSRRCALWRLARGSLLAAGRSWYGRSLRRSC